MYELMSRVAEPKPWAPKRFAPHFEEGFRRRENEGTPLAALAQQLIPDNFRLNLESAVQNMSRGIGRVRREHERCRKLGLPSPFLKSWRFPSSQSSLNFGIDDFRVHSLPLRTLANSEQWAPPIDELQCSQACSRSRGPIAASYSNGSEPASLPGFNHVPSRHLSKLAGG